MGNQALNNQHIVVCLQCGNIYPTIDDKRCNFCNGELVHTGVNEGVYYHNPQEIFKRLQETYVLTDENKQYNPIYANALREHNFKERERQNQINQQRQAAKIRSANACPKCGRDAGFTPVRRKWSLLTGFATNKVDMVCNHCGYVKK